MNSIYFDLITHENFDRLKTMFYEIFPEESHYDLKDFKDAINGTHNYGYLKYYYIHRLSDKACIGFIGVYIEKGSIDECWIGWFGILPQYRHNGYAREALNYLEQHVHMSELERDIIRVYTDKVINAAAVHLYKTNGYIQDSCYTYNFITLVKPLSYTAKVRPWLGIPIGFESEPPPGVEE